MVMEAIPAIFDGKSLLLDNPLKLKPNTRVIVRIETIEQEPKKKRSFLDTARSLNLNGPKDWSERLDYYLYHRQVESHG